MTISLDLERLEHIASYPLDTVESAVTLMRDEAIERKDFVSANAYDRVIDACLRERGVLRRETLPSLRSEATA